MQITNGVHFGFDQIMNAAPTIVGRIKRTLNFMSAGIVMYLPQAAHMFHTDVNTFSANMGLFMLAFNGIALMFGVQIDTKTVKSDAVTEIDVSKN